jgi:hypothetical protein
MLPSKVRLTTPRSRTSLSRGVYLLRPSASETRYSFFERDRNQSVYSVQLRADKRADQNRPNVQE